jgi:hypothetical protein
MKSRWLGPARDTADAGTKSLPPLSKARAMETDWPLMAELIHAAIDHNPNSGRFRRAQRTGRRASILQIIPHWVAAALFGYRAVFRSDLTAPLLIVRPMAANFIPKRPAVFRAATILFPFRSFARMEIGLVVPLPVWRNGRRTGLKILGP